jgi:hypothetical protein
MLISHDISPEQFPRPALRLQPKNALSRQTSGAMLLADRGYDELSANTMLG